MFLKKLTFRDGLFDVWLFVLALENKDVKQISNNVGYKNWR